LFKALTVLSLENTRERWWRGR